jgi:drug/metabolite transporter (DMT)-like permease
MLVGATLLWSLAGAVTRHLDAPLGAPITLWRSVFAGLFVLGYLALHGDPWSAVRKSGGAGILSGVMWATMFCCFMIALTHTTVANTLIVYSTAPLLTACLASAVLGTRVGLQTWIAIAVATFGLGWMYAGEFDVQRVEGMWIAFGVPVASAINLVTLKKADREVDLVPAILLGCILSIVAMLPFAWPLETTFHDLAWLAFLGVVQLGIPCIIMLRAVPHLNAPEISVLDLLEIVFGVLWAWLLAGETPSAATLVGGLAVLGGVVLSEAGPSLLPQRFRASV